MVKRPLKLLPVYLAISAVIIVAGIILMALLGFNTAADRNSATVFEVRYNVVIRNDAEKVKALGDLCEKSFEDNGLTIETVEHTLDSSDPVTVRYIMSASADEAKLNAAKSAIDTGVAAAYADAEVYADWHTESRVGGLYGTSVWRGAVAITVGAVVGLIYVAIRFGVGSALTGLVLGAHDAVFALSLLAIFRIPVYTYVPLLVAAVAAVVSVCMWLLFCMKLRDNKKDPDLKAAPADVSVGTAWEATWKRTLILSAVLAALFAVCGAVASAALYSVLLPLMIPAAVGAYSSLLLGPALHVHVKSCFDKLASKHKPRYIGKKKAAKTSESETAED